MSNCKITIRRNVRGKVQTKRYDNTEALFKDLNFEEIPSEFLPKSAKKELIFGIPAGEGRLTTNLDSSEFEFLNINPTNPEHSNEGRLYLGTESAVPGVLIPSAVRKKDMSEVDLNKEVPLMQQLKSFISQISEAAIKGDEATASQRIQDLRNIIYVGSKAGIPINLRTESNGPITSTYLVVTRGDQVENILIKETELTKDESVKGGFRENINVEKNAEEVSQELTQALVNVKAPFQVNKNDINGKWTIDRTLDYNNVLAEADVLTTNLEKNEVSQAYFVMNPLNSKLEEVKVNNAPIKTAKGTGGVSSTDSPLGREVTIDEGTFRVREGNKVYDAKNNLVANKEIVLKVITHDYLNNLSKEELEAITFKGREIPGIKSLHLGQTFQLMPNNRVWAGNRYLPTNDSTHNLIMEMNEKRKAEDSPQNSDINETKELVQEGLSQEETIAEEIPLFGNKVPETKGTRVRKRPKRGGVTNTALDSDHSSEMTTEQIQEEINRQKEYQKKNCPEIKP